MRLSFAETFERLQREGNERRSRAGQFPVAFNAETHRFLRQYAARRREVARLIERSWYFVPMMRQVFREEGLPEELVYLPVIESGYVAAALSPKKASGPWQFMAETGRLYGLANDWWVDERRDPEKSTRAAARHLRRLFLIFKDWNLALAAYNAGDGRLRRAIRESGGVTDFWTLCDLKDRKGDGLIPSETRAYVPKFMAALTVISHPQMIGLTNLAMGEPLVYDKVVLPDATDLEVIAACAGTDTATLRLYNPELKQWATPPRTNYAIKLPAGRAVVFLENYGRIPPEERVTYRRHEVRPGDTLWSIAHLYGVPREEIRSFNRLSDDSRIRAGSHLIIPIRGVRTNAPEPPRT